MLFPITNTTDASVITVVGSPVLGVTVGFGLSFRDLEDPVTIMLRLTEMEVGDKMHVRSGFMFQFMCELLTGNSGVAKGGLAGHVPGQSILFVPLLSRNLARSAR